MGGIFTDDQMAAAMIDHLMHHGHLLIFDGKVTRMEHALMRQDSAGESLRKYGNSLYNNRDISRKS